MPILFCTEYVLSSQAFSVMSHLKRSLTWSSVGRGHHTGETTSTITSSQVSLTLAKALTIPPFPGKRRGHSVESAAWTSSQLSLSQSSGWWGRTWTRWELALSGLLDTSAITPYQNVATLTRECNHAVWTVGSGREVVVGCLQRTQPARGGPPTPGARRVPSQTTRKGERAAPRRLALPSRILPSMTFPAPWPGYFTIVTRLQYWAYL